MAKTLAEATDQQATSLDRSSKKSSGENGGSKAIATVGFDGFKSQPERLRSFLDDVRAEMRKVIAPSREEVKSTTTIVVATVFLFAGYFALVDYVVGQGITRLITHLTQH
jgi:preprotein translocase subunit SecE